MPFGSLMMEPFQDNLHNRANTYSEQCWVSLKNLQTATEKGTPQPVLKLVSVLRRVSRTALWLFFPACLFSQLPKHSLCSSHQLLEKPLWPGHTLTPYSDPPKALLVNSLRLFLTQPPRWWTYMGNLLLIQLNNFGVWLWKSCCSDFKLERWSLILFWNQIINRAWVIVLFHEDRSI